MAYAPSANGLYTNNSLHTRNRGSHVQLARAEAHSVTIGRLLRRLSIPVAAISLALAAAGCHVPGTSSGSILPSGQTLTVAEVPGIDTVPLEVAVRQGLFKQQGISVTVKDYASVSDAYNALIQGKADVADGDYTSFFYGIANLGASLKLVADGYDASAGTMQVLALPSSGINSPGELVHRTVATPQAQAIVATDPLIIQAETQLGAQEVLDACSGVTASLPLSGYFSTASFAGQHSAALQAFRTALTTAESDAGQRSNVQSVLRGQEMSPLFADLVNIGQ